MKMSERQTHHVVRFPIPRDPRESKGDVPRDAWGGGTARAMRIVLARASRMPACYLKYRLFGLLDKLIKSRGWLTFSIRFAPNHIKTRRQVHQLALNLSFHVVSLDNGSDWFLQLVSCQIFGGNWNVFPERLV